MLASPTLFIFATGALAFFGVTLALIYRGRHDEGRLRRGTDYAGWILAVMCGIYMGFALTNHTHPYATIEIFFNGVLICILVMMRRQEVPQRLALASLLIGVHGLWDGLHFFALPLENNLVPHWYALACAVFDLGFFLMALPIFIRVIRTGHVILSQPQAK